MRDDPHAIPNFGTYLSRSLTALGVYNDCDQHRQQGLSPVTSGVVTSLQFGVTKLTERGIMIRGAAVGTAVPPMSPAG